MHSGLLGALWLAWLAYWISAARTVKDARRQESSTSRAAHVVPLVLAGALLASSRLPVPWLQLRLLPATAATYWAGVAILIAGLGFTVWARQHLAGNWSGTITLKRDHELIRSGPYRLVRHPIYTGLLTAVLGTAVAMNDWRGVLAFVIMAAAMVRKIGLEERWLGEAFPHEHRRYRAEVPALIPFLPGSRSDRPAGPP